MLLSRYVLPVVLGFMFSTGVRAGTEAGEEAGEKIQVSIERQPIRGALEQFANQTGLQVVLRDEDVQADRLIATRVAGQLSAQQALGRLLSGTDLRYEFVNEHTVRISRVQQTSRAVPAARQMRLAHVAGTSEAGQPGSQEENKPNPTKGIPEMLVKGKRSSNTDIERTEDDVQPYVVYDAETIERSMTTNLEEFLKTRLPMNTVADTNAQQTLLNGNTSSINLRGLGTDETLVLVNGRRMPGVFTGRELGQPDINGIPLSAVERVEILPATASGIYGGGATGGVVNIILKSDYNALELSTNYDNTFDTDSAKRRFDATLGFALEGGRTNVLLTGSYSDSNSLLVGDRNFVERAYELYLDNTQEDFTGGFSPPLGSTTNIKAYGFFGPELVLIDPNGGAPVGLGSLIAHVPLGYAGLATDGVAPLAATAGSYNINLPADVQGLKSGIVNNPVVTSFSANIRRQFTDRIEGFIDLSRNNNEGRVPYGSNNTSIDLFPGLGGNPFNNFIQVTFPMPGLEFDRNFTSETTAATGGLIVRLPGEWLGQLEYSWSRARSEIEETSPIFNSSIFSALLTGELDIFRDLNVATADFSPYLLDSPNSFRGPFDNTRTSTTLRLAGPVLELPGGDLTLSAFYENRQSEADDALVRLQDASTEEYMETIYPYRSRSAESLSLEATAPLISPRNARPGLHALDLQAAVRYDDYRINGVELGVVPRDQLDDVERSVAELNSADYTVGLRYAPIEDIALRASFGTGFLPPTVAQIIPSTSTGSVRLVDPERGGTSMTLTGIDRTSGGNPNLDPEKSESLSVGAIFTPRVLPGLRLSVDFTEIRKNNEIANVQAQTILDYAVMFGLFGDRVTRGPLTQADMEPPLNYTAGPITAIDFSSINIASTTVRAWDVQLDYLFDTTLGSFRLYALGSYIDDHINQFGPDTDPINNAGHQFRMKWRGNAGMTFERSLWSLGWNMQYFHSYLIYAAGLNEGLIESRVTEQGSPSIPRQIYHDLTARVRLGELAGATAGFLSDTELHIGLKNVFDTSPPIVATSVPSSGYSFFGDPRLRRYSITLRKRF